MDTSDLLFQRAGNSDVDISELLKQQENERGEIIEKNCLLCPLVFKGSWLEYITHMQDQHGFSIGLPENIVFIHQFIQLLESKINSLQCIYCELTFKTYQVLRQHMRKKKHLRIHSKNLLYKNYSNKEQEQDEEGSSEEDNDNEENWEEWIETKNPPCKCLYCNEKIENVKDCLLHMIQVHNFDFISLKKEWKLNFYECVGLINYVRNKVLLNQCVYCEHSFENAQLFEAHLKELDHCKIKNITIREWTSDTKYLTQVLEEDLLITEIPSDSDSSDD